MNRIRTTILVSIGLFFSFASSLVFAQGKACLMEGSFSFGGQKTEIKDCLQNNGVPQAQFTKICDTLSRTAVADDVPPAKITYMATCPSQSQGSCEKIYGQPVTRYHYKYDAKTLPGAKIACQSDGGKWK